MFLNGITIYLSQYFILMQCIYLIKIIFYRFKCINKQMI